MTHLVELNELKKMLFNSFLDGLRKKEVSLEFTNTHHYIFDFKISDNEIWKISLRNRIHNVILVLCRAVSGPVFITVVLMGEKIGVNCIPSVVNK